MQVDYLIIGQGLAGTLLGYQLTRAEKSFVVIDQHDESSSSRVAAGLFNPITGRRFVKTWKADILFPYLTHFYKDLEEYLKAKFFYIKDIYRPFTNVDEQNDWIAKSADPHYADYVSNIFHTSQYKDINDPFGGLAIKNGGFVDLPLMLKAARQKFIDEKKLNEEAFKFADLRIDKDGVAYRDIRAGKLIFCSGFMDAENPYFSWLPFRPVKGEVLHIKTKNPIKTIFNKACFITPTLNGISKSGSTYDWKDRKSLPTDRGRKIILENLRKLIDIDVNIVDQKAGIRPATLDRRPLIGVHPVYKTLAIFNGLGTKGVTLAPYYSEQFVSYLEYGANLDTEVDIKRYYSLYYNSNSSEKRR